MQFVFQNYEILHSVRDLYDKNSASWYCFTSDVISIKKYKRLVYMPPDLLVRFCKANLSHAKKFSLICFPRLIYCDQDQEPLWLLNVIKDDCYFFGVRIRLSTRCKIWFTLFVDCMQIIFL